MIECSNCGHSRLPKSGQREGRLKEFFKYLLPSYERCPECGSRRQLSGFLDFPRR